MRFHETGACARSEGQPPVFRAPPDLENVYWVYNRESKTSNCMRSCHSRRFRRQRLFSLPFNLRHRACFEIRDKRKHFLLHYVPSRGRSFRHGETKVVQQHDGKGQGPPEKKDRAEYRARGSGRSVVVADGSIIVDIVAETVLNGTETWVSR